MVTDTGADDKRFEGIRAEWLLRLFYKKQFARHLSAYGTSGKLFGGFIACIGYGPQYLECVLMALHPRLASLP